MQDASDLNPLIRGLAIRTMGYIHVDKITEALTEPLRKCLKVRAPATAVNISAPRPALGPLTLPFDSISCAAGRGPVRSQDGGDQRGQAL